MDDVKKVLLVTNSVNDDEINQIKKSLEEAAEEQNLKIELSLVHVVPNLPTCYFTIPSMVALAGQYFDEAKGYLTTVGESLHVPKKNQWLITGRIKSEVLRLAGKLGCDYILANSSNIGDLQQALTLKKEHLALLFRSFTAHSTL